MSENVQKITELAVNAHQSLQPKTDFPCLGLPDNYRIESLERHQIFKNRFSGEFITNTIKDFKAYCDRIETKDKSLCFIDQDNLSAKVILDLGNIEKPLHCQHTAHLRSKKTAAYEHGVLKAIKNTFTQQEVFNFLQDWKNNIQVTDANNQEITISTACQRILKIDINKTQNSTHEVSNYSQKTSAMAEIEAKATEGEQLPNGFLFTCKPYDSLNEYSFFLRLSLKISRDTPLLAMRCDGLEDLKQQMTDEFCDKLKTEFDENVIMGKFN